MKIGSMEWDEEKLLFLLGPCVIESEALLREVAAGLRGAADAGGHQIVFKASYDKANRSSVESYRGIGCEAGCEMLAAVGLEFGFPVVTDVHTVEEAEVAGRHVDMIQIPAFLCRQTDLIEAAARTGKPVNVKKGQFLAPGDVGNIAAKLRAFGCDEYFITERGTTFGYHNLVADMRSLAWMREAGHRVIFDATHSVQRPGGEGTSSGGDGVLAPVLARAAVAAGCEGVFVETHPRPEEAFSDGPNQVLLEKVPALLALLEQIHHITRNESNG
ncbi:MAG: 3-deoxy-8-phosphooctulonate synthase [Verrucomicrobiota bacterium]